MTGSVVPPTTISDETVRVAANALHRDRYGWNAPHAGILESVHRASAEHDARAALLAAVPYIEAGLRAKIAAEIEAQRATRGAVGDATWNDGLLFAARVARGTQEATK